MKRRVFVTGVAGLLAAPLAAEAQAGKVPRVGFLSPNSASDPGWLGRLRVFQQGIRELGYVEGRNIVIESRWAEGKWDRLPGLAAELVGLKVDVIVTYGPPAIQAAKQATGTIPIIMAGVIDPGATGFAAAPVAVENPGRGGGDRARGARGGGGGEGPGFGGEGDLGF